MTDTHPDWNHPRTVTYMPRQGEDIVLELTGTPVETLHGWSGSVHLEYPDGTIISYQGDSGWGIRHDINGEETWWDVVVEPHFPTLPKEYCRYYSVDPVDSNLEETFRFGKDGGF